MFSSKRFKNYKQRNLELLFDRNIYIRMVAYAHLEDFENTYLAEYYVQQINYELHDKDIWGYRSISVWCAYAGLGTAVQWYKNEKKKDLSFFSNVIHQNAILKMNERANEVLSFQNSSFAAEQVKNILVAASVFVKKLSDSTKLHTRYKERLAYETMFSFGAMLGIQLYVQKQNDVFTEAPSQSKSTTSAKPSTVENTVCWRNRHGKIDCPGDDCPMDCDETCPIFLNTQGLEYLMHSRPAIAIEKFEKACKIAPDYPDVWTNSGNAYGCTGNAQKAYECFHRAHLLDPKRPQPLFGLVQTSKDLGNFAEMQTWCEEYERVCSDGKARKIVNAAFAKQNKSQHTANTDQPNLSQTSETGVKQESAANSLPDTPHPKVSTEAPSASASPKVDVRISDDMLIGRNYSLCHDGIVDAHQKRLVTVLNNTPASPVSASNEDLKSYYPGSWWIKRIHNPQDNERLSCYILGFHIEKQEIVDCVVLLDKYSTVGALHLDEERTVIHQYTKLNTLPNCIKEESRSLFSNKYIPENASFIGKKLPAAIIKQLNDSSQEDYSYALQSPYRLAYTHMLLEFGEDYKITDWECSSYRSSGNAFGDLVTRPVLIEDTYEEIMQMLLFILDQYTDQEYQNQFMY